MLCGLLPDAMPQRKRTLEERADELAAALNEGAALTSTHRAAMRLLKLSQTATPLASAAWPQFVRHANSHWAFLSSILGLILDRH